jgi:hypothetical protein
MATRTVHFVLYLPDQGFAIYRRTAAGSRAALVVTNVPADVSDRAVEIAANLTAIAVPSGMPRYRRLRAARQGPHRQSVSRLTTPLSAVCRIAPSAFYAIRPSSAMDASLRSSLAVVECWPLRPFLGRSAPMEATNRAPGNHDQR